jgi:parallel beta-helix repeat protein
LPKLVARRDDGQILGPDFGQREVRTASRHFLLDVAPDGRLVLTANAMPQQSLRSDLLQLAAVLLLLVAVPASAAVRYVNVNNKKPASPFTSWSSAAAVIQDAIDVAAAGDEIVVTNGVYLQGGSAVYGTLTNRVAVTRRLTLRSVNGPARTIIEGSPTNGIGAIRCVYLTNGAVLSGFTLTNGATRSADSWPLAEELLGGGVWCESANEVVSNCVLVACTAGDSGGGAYGGTLRTCSLTGNSASYGGGVSSCVLSNCTLAGNVAVYSGGGADASSLDNCVLSNCAAGDLGGGAYGSTLKNCALTGNSASRGGGVSSCVLSNCTLAGNLAGYLGGGADASRLDNCTLTDNSADSNGGGAYQGSLHSCVLSGNSAAYSGGGTYGGALTNCTLTGNSAATGGGADSSTLINSVLYYNAAASHPNYSASTLYYCCTTPLPTNGTANLAVEPQLASAWHLSGGSPCRGAGSAGSATGVDIDGEPWASLPAIGSDEYRTGAITGPLSLAVRATYTNVAAGFTVDFKATIDGRCSASRWEFGDGVVVSNRPYASHSWVAAGDYPVVLRAYNESYPGGVTVTVMVHVALQPVTYVALTSGHPLAPYTSWATAATTLQDAADVAYPGGTVLVSNGVYRAGGRVVYGTLTNRVAVTKPVSVRSLNGPAVTAIEGCPAISNNAARCVYLTNGACLSGFTLTNGATLSADSWPLAEELSGGGVWCESASEVVSNCVVVACSAGDSGGGAYGGTLKNCILTGNSAVYGGGVSASMLSNCSLTGNLAGDSGGGADSSTLDNCTLADNSADSNGGGAYWSSLHNCVLTGNSAPYWGGGAYGGALTNCTLTGNRAASGGGVTASTMCNSILYYNSAASEANYSGGTFSYCCTTPLPTNGMANLVAEPQLASAWHLNGGSPCRGKGCAASVTGVDIDGEPWANPPAIGCDEYRAGAITGLLSLAIQASYTNVAAGFTVDFTAAIDGHCSASRWEFGDGLVVSNRPYAAHSWAGAGDYPVVLRAYNESYPGGVTVTVMVHVALQPVTYVALTSPQTAAPYTSWTTAARSLQDAADAAYPGGMILVSNGVYRVGGRVVYGTLTNRVAVTKPVTVRSLNGPAVTVIEGFPAISNNAVRCVYLAEGAALTGFTLTNGATGSLGDATTEQSGGGVWCESASILVSNCVLTGNSATSGGGSFRGMLNNCTIATNSATYGGGAYSCALSNCTMTGNSAGYAGGGANLCALKNCTLAGNSASYSGGAAEGGKLDDCVLTNNSAVRWAGASSSVLNNCLIAGNKATLSGGGGGNCLLNNCTLVRNSADSFGGAESSTLNYCNISSNSATSYGGGAGNCLLNNCTLAGNTTGGNGGGAFYGTLNNCLLVWNSAKYGGGAYGSSTLSNCTLTGNSGWFEGGGTSGGTLRNCIVYYNTAAKGPNYMGNVVGNVSMNYCCTLPLPASGTGNLTNPPAFMNQAGSNLRLQNNSPCINSGRNTCAPAGPDLDGNPRIADGTVDLGAYESQAPGSSLSYAWLQQYGLAIDGSADNADPDQDGLPNWQEFRSGTNPTNALSTLRLLTASHDATGVTVTWQSVTNRHYFLERGTDPSARAFCVPLASNLLGQPIATAYKDTNTSGSGMFFYRVGVQDSGE